MKTVSVPASRISSNITATKTSSLWLRVKVISCNFIAKRFSHYGPTLEQQQQQYMAATHAPTLTFCAVVVHDNRHVAAVARERHHVLVRVEGDVAHGCVVFELVVGGHLVACGQKEHTRER